jgi:glutamyl-tRNA synthetase/nondiscriminating glutamyl-tRNA synthetase
MNVDELRALSARYFRAADPEDQLRTLDSTLPANDPWHELGMQLRLDLVTGLRENAATLDELRSLLPHFTAHEVRYTATALAELAGGLDVLRALAEAIEGLDPQSRLTAKEASALLGQTATRAGAKGRALYHPIRLALTGSGAGPELSALLTLLTVGRIRERIQAAIPSFPSTTKE